jgi:hypothetical protein
VSTRKFPSYALNGASESRLEQEFDQVYRVKLDLPLKIHNEVPKVNTVAEGEPILALDGGNWYIYIKVRGNYKRVQLTAV